MKQGIEETDKSFIFYRQIEKTPVKISLRCGWIWIEENLGRTGVFGIMGPIQKSLQTYTKEDAKNLMAAIQELLPENDELEKHD